MPLLLLIFLIIPCSAADLERYDSLFIQASAASYKHQYLVEPAREKLLSAGREAMPFLISKFTTNQPREYQALKDIFRKIKPELAAEFIAPILRNKTRQTYNPATEFLGIAGGRQLASLLYPDLEHDSLWVRLAAIRSLGSMKDTTAEKLLAKQLTHNDYRVRWYTAAALGKIATEYALTNLFKVTGDSLQLVKMTAYLYLKNNLKQLPDLKKKADTSSNLILHRLAFLQNRQNYSDSTKFKSAEWRFISSNSD